MNLISSTPLLRIFCSWSKHKRIRTVRQYSGSLAHPTGMYYNGKEGREIFSFSPRIMVRRRNFVNSSFNIKIVVNAAYSYHTVCRTRAKLVSLILYWLLVLQTELATGLNLLSHLLRFALWCPGGEPGRPHHAFIAGYRKLYR